MLLFFLGFYSTRGRILHLNDLCPGWSLELEEGTGEVYIRSDMGEAGARYISQTIVDIHLDDEITFFVNGQ
jgi:6-phosphogluconolactonase/glucosamine-6-phosphate isomerase/deaminase